MRKLCRSQRARQNRAAFRKGNNIAVSVQRFRYVAKRISDRERHRGSIGNAAQSRGHVWIEIADELGSHISRSRENHSVSFNYFAVFSKYAIWRDSPIE